MLQEHYKSYTQNLMRLERKEQDEEMLSRFASMTTRFLVERQKQWETQETVFLNTNDLEYSPDCAFGDEEIDELD